MALLAAAQAAKALPAGDAIEDAVDEFALKEWIGAESWQRRPARRDAQGRRRNRRYSRDLNAALHALREFFCHYLWDSISLTGTVGGEWRCEVDSYAPVRGADGRAYAGSVEWHAEGVGNTPALAACRAMLDVEDGSEAEEEPLPGLEGSFRDGPVVLIQGAGGGPVTTLWGLPVTVVETDDG